MNSRSKTILCGLLCLFAGAALGWALRGGNVVSLERGVILREGSAKYRFINPILSCEIAPQEAFTELAPLRREVSGAVRSHLAAEGVSDISVYGRMLNSGRWFGVNEEETYAPASLLKTILMVSYFKVAEANPAILRRRLSFAGHGRASATENEFSSSGPLAAGTYTVEELIDHMIIDSSNDALNLLLDSMDEETFRAFKETSSDLNIPLTASADEDTNENFLSPKSYSSIFRVLFGSTYLNRQLSENALELLSRTTFGGGLTAKLPRVLAVSHKFGIRSVPVKAAAGSLRTERELHDCGIVYYPKHPYLLCVMTRGNDFAALADTISDISATTYRWLAAFWERNS